MHTWSPTASSSIPAHDWRGMPAVASMLAAAISLESITLAENGAL